MELQFERCERIMAPLPLVWEELDSLDHLLDKMALARYDVHPDGGRASARVILRWGPLNHAVDLEMTLVGTMRQRQIRYAFQAPRLSVRLEGAINLIPLGSSETKLDHRGAVDVQHRFAARVRGQLQEIMEDYADTIVDRVRARAENRGRAQEQLG